MLKLSNKSDYQNNDKKLMTNDKILKLIDLYFNEKFIIYKMQYDAYNQFIYEIIHKTLVLNDNIICVNEDKEKNIIYEYSFRFSDINLRYPENEKGNIIYPEDARKSDLSYSSKLLS